MDGSELILREAVGAPSLLAGAVKDIFYGESAKLEANGTDGASEERKKQVAKDFESVLIGKLLDQMQETVGNWGFEEDGTSSQIQGIFWMYLARDIANKGGLGMWKDIYQFLTDAGAENVSAGLADKKI